MQTTQRWRTTAMLEIAVMVALLLSYIWGWRGTFAAAPQVIMALYFGLGVLSHLRRGESARQIGLRFDNVLVALRNATLLVVPVVGVSLAIGAILSSWQFNSWNDGVSRVAAGIAWGTAQQYGLLCFFYRRCLEIFGGPQAATVGASVIFAGFHAPNPFLFAVTLAAGAASCALYRRAPNVIVLGVAHAAISFVLLCALPYSVTHGLRVGPSYLGLG